MGVVVFAEHSQGIFRKSAQEAVSFAKALADKMKVPVHALVLGAVDQKEAEKLGAYGADTIWHDGSSQAAHFDPKYFAGACAALAQQTKAKAIIVYATFNGRSFAPRVAVKLDALYADNIIEVPEVSGGGIAVRKKAFSNKAIARMKLGQEVSVLSPLPNSFSVTEAKGEGKYAAFSPDAQALSGYKVLETKQNTDKIPLPDADLVVSAGRGLKGPENWGMIEELAGELGAATACSKPVSDAGWRPHSEHVGQTGIAISPNLYVAVGISGAIQHLAGVSSSKTIVVINKDPEAPFFKAADYGIVGDAFDVVPRLTQAVKKLKA